MLKSIFLSFSLLLPLLTLGETLIDNDNPDITTITTADGPAKAAVLHCPNTQSLTFDSDTKTWSAPNDFKSFNTSFVNTAQSFLGAQWTGAGLGQIFCVYSGPDSGPDIVTLPIVLAHNVISREPKPSDDNSWGKKQANHYNCISNDPIKCPFLVRVKAPEKTLDEEFNLIKPGSIPSSD
ncbi:MAG: hypothetical protein CMF55_04995 [Legionellales bacterium]|nr:hypothetical protein [Legionellales bacterium]HAG61416.1 hypothetical protein [Coxiellaceae bacterium]